MSKLTERQKRFADEYLIDLNGTQAAIRAGYSAKTAEVTACRLLRNNKVQEYIQRQQKRLQDKTNITQEKVIAELAAIALSETTDFVANGLPIVEKALHKTASKLRALEMLGKYLGLFDKQSSEEGEEAVHIVDDI